MASNPPAASGLSGVKQSGYARLFWGTEALGNVANTSGSSYIVVSARAGQVAETIKTPQGSGLTAVVTQIIDGQSWNFTVEEDLAIAPPPVGTVVVLQNVFMGALGNTIAPWGNTAIANTGNFLVTNNDFNAERKAAGTRVIVAEAFVAITGLTGGGNPNLGT